MPSHTAIYRPPELPAERVAACLGLISDTHMPDRCLTLPPALFEVLDGVDLVLHAGDLGELWVLDQLSAITPVIAVHGNDETAEAQRELPYQQLVSVAGQRIVLSHCHFPDRDEELASRRDDTWGPKLARRATFGTQAKASIVVFGHTHIPMTKHYDGVLLVNPGAIASGGLAARQRIQTVALLYIRDDGVPYVAHVDLAAPNRPFISQIDWSAGFRAALDQFSEPILTPALVAISDQIFRIATVTPEPTWSVLRRIALPYISGEREVITPAMLLAGLRAEPDLPAHVLADFEALLEPLVAGEGEI